MKAKDFIVQISAEEDPLTDEIQETPKPSNFTLDPSLLENMNILSQNSDRGASTITQELDLYEKSSILYTEWRNQQNYPEDRFFKSFLLLNSMTHIICQRISFKTN